MADRLALVLCEADLALLDHGDRHVAVLDHAARVRLTRAHLPYKEGGAAPRACRRRRGVTLTVWNGSQMRWTPVP